MKAATLKMERAALKWRALAERRRKHMHDLQRSGRWRHYYTEDQIRDVLQASVVLAERWAAIAPLPEELEPAADATALPPAA